MQKDHPIPDRSPGLISIKQPKLRAAINRILPRSPGIRYPNGFLASPDGWAQFLWCSG